MTRARPEAHHPAARVDVSYSLAAGVVSNIATTMVVHENRPMEQEHRLQPKTAWSRYAERMLPSLRIVYPAADSSMLNEIVKTRWDDNTYDVQLKEELKARSDADLEVWKQHQLQRAYQRELSSRRADVIGRAAAERLKISSYIRERFCYHAGDERLDRDQLVVKGSKILHDASAS